MALEESVLLAVGALALWHLVRTNSGENKSEKKAEEIPYRTPSL